MYVFLRFLERLCWLSGGLLSAFFLASLVQGEVQRTGVIDQLELAWAEAQPDTSLWSAERIEAWRASRTGQVPPAVAVLSMPELGLEVPVFDTDSDLNMDRGAGLIAGTARPAEAGNVGIAGHRDGYFRVLKDASPGDSLRLRTAAGEQYYRVTEVMVVDPLDVEVLDPTEHASVTLVTCYPFYYVGSAPQRFIVRAQLDTAMETPKEKLL